MNPLWGATSNAYFDTTGRQANSNFMGWMCTESNFTAYKTSQAEMVIGGPPIEMFAKSYNVAVGSNALVPIYGGSTLNGYDFSAIPAQIVSGPNGIYWQNKTDNYWTCSGDCSSADRMQVFLPQYGNFGAWDIKYNTYGLAPVVSIGRP